MAAATAPFPAPAAAAGASSPDAPHKAVRDLAAAARLLLTALVDDSEADDPDDALNRQYAAVIRSFHAAIAALRTAKVDVSAWCTFPDNLRTALEAVVGGHDEDDEEAEAVSGAHLHALLTTTVRAMHDALQSAVDGNAPSAAAGPATQPGSGSGSGSASGAVSGTGSAAARAVQQPASPRQPTTPAAVAAAPAPAPALPARRPTSPTAPATAATRMPAPVPTSPTRDRPLPTIPAQSPPVPKPTAPAPTTAPVLRPTSPRSPVRADSAMPSTAVASRSPVRSGPTTPAAPSRATSPRAAAPPPLAPSTPDPGSADTAASVAAAQALQQLRLDLVTILSTLPPPTDGAPLPASVASHLASIRMHIDSVLPRTTSTNLPPTEPASPTTAARDHVTLAHRRVSADLATLADRVDDMAALVDALRHDMVTRGAVPAHAVLAYAKAEHASVVAAVETTRASVARERPTWKAVWEAELHRVVEEQEFLDAAVEQVNSVADRAAQAEAVVQQLARVAELADKHPRAVLPRRSASASASATLGFPEDDDGEDAGLATVLHELATVLDADTAAAASPRRVRAALRTERVRAWARQFHRPTSAFGGELRAFLGLPADDREGGGGAADGAMSPGGTRLRATGGVEAVERARAERDRAVLAALAKGGAT
ncbi:Bud site selection protein 6 [Allomyces arbusculus]|nr:Bud site selection protein 6 [Allomyces arbusculus]